MKGTGRDKTAELELLTLSSGSIACTVLARVLGSVLLPRNQPVSTPHIYYYLLPSLISSKLFLSEVIPHDFTRIFNSLEMALKFHFTFSVLVVTSLSSLQ